MLDKASRFGVLGFFLSIATLLTAGCNSGNTVSPTTSPCVLPAGIQATLVYPAPNSTHNSTSLPQIYVATSSALPVSWDVELLFPGGSAYLGGTVQSVSYASIPTPNQTPSFSNPIYYSSAFNNVIQPIPSGTTITATLNDTSSSCFPGVTLANFST